MFSEASFAFIAVDEAMHRLIGAVYLHLDESGLVAAA